MRILVPLLALAACTDETDGLVDIDVRVRIPKEASHVWVDGETRSDLRSLGPVYVGAYASVVDDSFVSYPYPETAAALEGEFDPPALPYGGTSVGRFAWPCYPSLVCRTVSGRFTDYDDVMSYFADLDDPVLDANGEPVTDPEQYRQACHQSLDVDDDARVDFLSEGALFEDDGDTWVADVVVPGVRWVKGMSLWGWMDTPSDDRHRFATCDVRGGLDIAAYPWTTSAGAAYRNLLNRPALFIGPGDYSTDDWPVLTRPEQRVELTLGYHHE